MPVLLKLKPGVTPAQIDEFKKACKAMVGQVPGTYTTFIGSILIIWSFYKYNLKKILREKI